MSRLVTNGLVYCYFRCFMAAFVVAPFPGDLLGRWEVFYYVGKCGSIGGRYKAVHVREILIAHYHCYLWPVSLYRILTLCLINGKILGEKV